jgi:hypothetical protein
MSFDDELGEAVEDIIDTLANAGADGTITIRYETVGVLVEETGQVPSTPTEDALVKAIRSSESASRVPLASAATIEVGEIGYYVLASALSRRPQDGDEVDEVEGGQAVTRTIGRVEEAGGGHALALICMDAVSE